jgi:UDP-N-acetyl-2-amino-2-deoxyglucuronate dehydrogenase
MAEPIGIGIIGAGEISLLHAASYKALADRARLVAVADIDESRARFLADHFEIPAVYKDYQALLANPDVQAVSICTPPFVHVEQSMEAMGAGKHVLCEKPVAPNLAALDRIASAQEDSGRIFSGVFQYRLGQGARQVKALIERGRFGRLLFGLTHTLWMRQASYYDVWWRGSWAQECGGTSVSHGIHGIDLLLWLMGEPEHVYAEADTLKMDIEVDDTSLALVRFRSGALGQILSTINCQDNRTRLEVYGTELAAVSSDDAYQSTKGPFRLSAADESYLEAVEKEAAELVPSAPPYVEFGMVEEFVSAVEDDREPLVTVAECRRSLELITGLYRSAMTGERVSLPIDKADPFYSSIPPEGMALPRASRRRGGKA